MAKHLSCSLAHSLQQVMRCVMQLAWRCEPRDSWMPFASLLQLQTVSQELVTRMLESSSLTSRWLKLMPHAEQAAWPWPPRNMHSARRMPPGGLSSMSRSD